MCDQCAICLESATLSPYVECTAKHHSIHNCCVDGYLREVILPQVYKLRDNRCSIKCVIPDCPASISLMSLYDAASNQERMRLSILVRELMFDDPEIVQIRNMIFDQLTLKCPFCSNTVDPLPDACSAVNCLSCGHYYCNCCFMSFSNSPKVEQLPLAHEHTAGHHPSLSPTERSSFLPQDIIKQGQKTYQKQQLFQKIILYLMEKKSSPLKSKINSFEVSYFHNMEITLIILADELKEIDIGIIDFWTEILFDQTAQELCDEIVEQNESASMNEKTMSFNKSTSLINSTMTNNDIHAPVVFNPPTLKDLPLEAPFASASSPAPRQGGFQLANAIITLNVLAIEQLFSTFQDTLDVNFLDAKETGQPVASLAVLAKLNDIAIRLIQKGADPLQKCVNNSTPGRSVLYIVLEVGAYDVFEAILQCHPNISLEQSITSGPCGFFPIHVVANYGRYQLLQRLIEFQVNLEVKEGEHGHTPLVLALVMGSEWCANLLIQSNANIRTTSNSGKSALAICAEKGLLSSLEFMMDHNKVNPDEVADMRLNYRLLHISALYKQPSVTYFLLCAGANPNYVEKEFGYTPLHMALVNDNVVCALMLLHSGCDAQLPTKLGRRPLYVACERGHDAVIKPLVDHGAKINKPATSETSKRSALHVAILYKHNHLIPTLISLGADVNTTEKEGGWTPLMMALTTSNETAALMLIKSGAIPDIKSLQKRCAMYIAVEKGLCAVISALIKTARVSVDGICSDDEFAYRPLHVAAVYNKPMAAWTLLRLGANIDLKSKQGNKAMKLAVQFNSADVIKVLEGYSKATP